MALLVKTDAELREEVLTQIELDPRFQPAELGVEVDDGIVTLDGTVSSYDKVLVAADIAAAIPAVKGVANRLTVGVREIDVADDTQIAMRVREALRTDPVAAGCDGFEVIVRDGVVILGGSVAYAYQLTSALEAIKRVRGARALRNNVRVAAPRWTDADVKIDIEATIRRQLPLVSKRIDVAVTDGVVTLSGSVRFSTERQLAEKIAWSPAPVRNVINSITTTW